MKKLKYQKESHLPWWETSEITETVRDAIRNYKGTGKFLVLRCEIGKRELSYTGEWFEDFIKARNHVKKLAKEQRDMSIAHYLSKVRIYSQRDHVLFTLNRNCHIVNTTSISNY